MKIDYKSKYMNNLRFIRIGSYTFFLLSLVGFIVGVHHIIKDYTGMWFITIILAIILFMSGKGIVGSITKIYREQRRDYLHEKEKD